MSLITKEDEYQTEIQKLKDSNPGYYPFEDRQLIEIIKKQREEAKRAQGKHQNPKEAEFSAKDYQKERKDWEKFYQYNEKTDFSKVKIPNPPAGGPKGNWRLLFIKRNLTLNQALDRCKELFNTWRYTEDLDKTITENSRNPTQHYAIWVQNEEEPDKEYLGKSTKDADPDMKIGVTLLERLVLELKYYEETKKHLDIKGITFCTGSRDFVGVPSVCWNGGSSKLEVYCYNPDHCNSLYGLRSAVS